MALYRAAVGNYYIKDEDNSHLISDAELVYQYGFTSPLVLIRISRLSLLCRIIAKNSEYVLGLIRGMSHVPSGWISGVKEDLNIISCHPLCSVFKDRSIQHCIEVIAQDPRYWNKCIKHTQKKASYWADD